MNRLVLIILLLILPVPGFTQSYYEVNLGYHRAEQVKFHPQSDQIAFAIGNKVKLYRSGVHVATLHDSNLKKVNNLDFNLHGDLLITGHNNGSLVLWDTREKKVIRKIDISRHPINTCFFLGSGLEIMALADEKISKWTLDGKPVQNEMAKDHPVKLISQSGDRSLLAVLGTDGRLSIFDDSHTLIWTAENEDPVRRITISPKNNLLGIGTNNGKVKVIDLEDNSSSIILEVNSRINTLEFSNDGQYLSVGSENFYIMSLRPNHPNVIYKKLYGEVYSSSFSPNGKEVCLLEDWNPYAKIFNISDLGIPSIIHFKEGNDHIAPQIYISNPPKIINEKINYSNDLIEIKGAVFDDYGIRRLSLNGKQTPINANGKFLINYPLTYGKNEISLEAEDINGNIAAKRFTINRNSEQDNYDPEIAQNFLFAVGIDDYEAWPDLNNAVKDINDLSEILMKKFGFNFENVTIIRNEQATRNNIIKGLRAQIEEISAQDNLLIYFSGHGFYDDILSEGYWIPRDASNNESGDFLSNTTILKILDNIKAQHIFLISDACFSGSMFTSKTRGGLGMNYIEQLEKYRSRWGLASGRLETVSDGEMGMNSPFARVLIEYLINSQDTEFAVSELIQYAKMRVPEVSNQTPIGNPLRLKDDEGGEFIFKSNYPESEAITSIDD